MPGTEAQSAGSRSTEAKHRAHLPAVGYARVSTDEQAREGVSLEAQRSRIRAYCEAKELELVDVLVDDLFLARHIELHSVSESLDTSTPHGRFVLTLFGGLAQMERELIGERTRSALAFKRENGQPTSHPPLGFRANGSRETMVPVPRELVIVRRILRAWRLGQSYRTIAGKLTADGVPTKQGGQWHHSTIGKVVGHGGSITRRLWDHSRRSVATPHRACPL